MLDTPCSGVVWRVLANHSIRQFLLHFPSLRYRVPSHFNWTLLTWWVAKSNAGYTMFRYSVKSTGYPLHSPVSPFTSSPLCHRVPSHFKRCLPRPTCFPQQLASGTRQQSLSLPVCPVIFWNKHCLLRPVPKLWQQKCVAVPQSVQRLTGRSGDWILGGATFSAPVQTGLAAHTASHTRSLSRG